MTTQKKFTLQIIITAVALVLVLVYNFVHTGGLLASYVAPWWIGYVAALGIELAVVGLSLQIGRRRRDHEATAFFYFVLIAVVVVSALANMSQGHVQRYATDITVETVTTIDVIQGIVGIAATALLSLIVMAMAEIVGQYMEQDDAQEQPAVVTMATTKTAQVQQLARDEPGLTRAQLAETIGCSMTTVNRALMNDNGRKEPEGERQIEPR